MFSAGAQSRKKEPSSTANRTSRWDSEHEERSDSVIGAAIEVHKALGFGFLESVYENALAIVLAARGIGFERQLAVPDPVSRR
jgi:hypothetical protein